MPEKRKSHIRNITMNMTIEDNRDNEGLRTERFSNRFLKDFERSAPKGKREVKELKMAADLAPSTLTRDRVL